MNTEHTGPEKEPQRDGAQSEAQRQEKRRALIRRVVLVLCILGGVGLGLLLRQAGPKQSPEKRFNADGLELTLASRFAESGDRNGFDRAYYSNREAIFVSHEPAGSGSLADFAAARAAALAAGGAVTELRENGLSAFECRSESEGRSYACLLCFLEADGQRWTLVFRCAPKDYEKYRAEYLQFAASARPDTKLQ